MDENTPNFMAFFYQSDSSISFDFTELQDRVQIEQKKTIDSIAKLFTTSLILHIFLFSTTLCSLITLLTTNRNLFFACSIALFILSLFSWISFRSFEKTKLQIALKEKVDSYLQEINKLLPIDIDCITKQTSLMQALDELQKDLFNPTLFTLKIHPFTFGNKILRDIAFYAHSPHLKYYIFAIIEKIHFHNCILIEQMPTSSLAHKNFARALLNLYNQLRSKKQVILPLHTI